MTSPELVLLLTHSGDYYTIDLVEAALSRLDVPHLRVDTDLFPGQWSISTEIDGDGCRGWLHMPEQRVGLSTVGAVWARRLWPGRSLPALEPRFAAMCAREARTALFDILGLLDDAYWINPLAAGTAAESKLLQLRAAIDCGLSVPTTVIGNHPDSVRQLYDRLDGNMVTKLLGALSQSMDASGDFVYTAKVEPADMAAIEDLRLAPQVFQQLIGKRSELRAVFVGDKTFVGAIDASGHRYGEVDWRRLTTADGVRWTEAELPDDVEQACRRLLQRLGLVFGAADFIIDHDGRHIFLEVNQAGEWGWLQRDLGLPVAEAIAEELAAGRSASSFAGSIPQ